MLKPQQTWYPWEKIPSWWTIWLMCLLWGPWDENKKDKIRFLNYIIIIIITGPVCRDFAHFWFIPTSNAKLNTDLHLRKKKKKKFSESQLEMTAASMNATPELVITSLTRKFSRWPAAQLEDSLWSAFHFRPGVNQLPDAGSFCACSWENREIKERLLITQSKYGLWFQKMKRRKSGSWIEML